MISNYFKNITLRGIFNWVLIGVIVFFVIKDCKRKQDQEKKLTSVEERLSNGKTTKTSIEAAKIAKEANQKGDTVTIYERAEPIIKTLELRFEDKQKVDSLLKINNIKEKNLQSITTLYAEASAKNLKLSKIIQEGSTDTVWTYRDKYITNTISRKDTMFVSDIWLDATVSKIDYNKKKYWFFGENENLSKVWFNSPYIKPAGMDYLEVKQKEKLVDVNLSVGTQYMHSQKELFTGPKINLKIGRFYLNGGYYLNPGGKIGNTFIYGVDYKVY